MPTTAHFAKTPAQPTALWSPIHRRARATTVLLLPTAFLVALSALLGCASSDAPSGGRGSTGFQELDPAAAQQLIEARRGQDQFVILDVRTPGEFQSERIAGSINIDFRSPTFGDEVARLDRDATYLLYCRTGNRSRQSLSTFRDLGFRDVRHLTRGITAWKAEGHRVVSGG